MEPSCSESDQCLATSGHHCGTLQLLLAVHLSFWDLCLIPEYFSTLFLGIFLLFLLELIAVKTCLYLYVSKTQEPYRDLAMFTHTHIHRFENLQAYAYLAIKTQYKNGCMFRVEVGWGGAVGALEATAGPYHGPKVNVTHAGY